jgi:hypothetical protein
MCKRIAFFCWMKNGVPLRLLKREGSDYFRIIWWRYIVSKVIQNSQEYPLKGAEIDS